MPHLEIFGLKLEVYELVLVAGLLVGLLIQLYYYLLVFTRVAVRKRSSATPVDCPVQPPVSVIICARNEAENLKRFLPQIFAQEYADYEVVVVNDCSTDDTDMLLSAMLSQYPRLRVTSINQDAKFMYNKKLALTVGIKSAKHDWVLLTDADCYPETPLWLSSMAQRFVKPTELVIGYGGYEAAPGLLNKLVRYDTMFNAVQYLSAAINGHPYMAVGRNLAYRRDLFFGNRGFASHSHILSGDDDLFVRDVATRTNTAVSLHPDSFTRSIPRPTYRAWIKQKVRHVSTSSHYRFDAKLRIALEPISRLLLFGTAITLLVLKFYPVIIVSALIFRYIIQLLVIKGAMNRLHERKLLLISPLWDFYSLYLYAKVLLINLFSSKKAPSWR